MDTGKKVFVDQLIIKEVGSPPATPDTGYTALYIKSSDKKIYTKDETGSESSVGSSVNSKSFSIANPTGSSSGPVWRTPVAITITAIHVLCIADDDSGTNVTGQLWNYDTNGANGAVVDNTDIVGWAGINVDDDGSLSAPSILANHYIGWRTTSVSGIPTRVIITFEYTVA